MEDRDPCVCVNPWSSNGRIACKQGTRPTSPSTLGKSPDGMGPDDWWTEGSAKAAWWEEESEDHEREKSEIKLDR